MNFECKKNPFCAMLSEEERALLCQNCFQTTLTKMQKIHWQTFFHQTVLVLDGLLADIAHEKDGKITVVSLRSENDLLNVYYAFTQKPMYCQEIGGRIAITESRIAIFPHTVIRKLFRSNPKIAEYIFIREAENAMWLCAYEHMVNLHDAYHALLYLLDYLRCHNIPMLTHEELAFISNLTRATVTRTLSKIIKNDDYAP